MGDDGPPAVETPVAPTPGPAATLATVYVILPPFWPSDPEIWFAQLHYLMDYFGENLF